MTRLEECLSASARRRPEHVALVQGTTSVTYRTLAARVDDVAVALTSAGVSPGDRVVFIAESRLEAVVAFWAILVAGAVAVPVGAQTKPEKLRWLLQHCSASALVERERVVMQAPTERHARDTSLAAILYTSGSTGTPKGVMLSHGNMTSAATSIAGYLGIEEHDVIHVLSPLSFDYGLYQVILGVRAGARVVLAPSFHLPGQVLKQAAAEHVTFFPAVPTQIAMIGALRDISPWDLSRVRVVTSTAATLTPAHIASVEHIFPQARLFSMYGLTECKRCTYLPPADLHRKPDSIGIAIPGTETWLVDEEGNRLGPHEIGQLVVRGPHVMQGYWRDAVSTVEMLRPGPSPGERVLYTGDLCRTDEEGYLYFVARTDDIIKSRGQKVAPREVEVALSNIHGVQEAAVIGVPDDLLGQALKAFVVADSTLTAGDILRGCRERLEPLLVPTHVELVAALPKTPNGKIDRLLLNRR